MVAPGEFEEKVRASSLMVAHAGMGVIIAAAEIGRPIVLMPRLASRREHTTDHQVHTAARLVAQPGIFVAETQADLPAKIAEAQAAGNDPRSLLPRAAPAEFIGRIRLFLTGQLS